MTFTLLFLCMGSPLSHIYGIIYDLVFPRFPIPVKVTITIIIAILCLLSSFSLHLNYCFRPNKLTKLVRFLLLPLEKSGLDPCSDH